MNQGRSRPAQQQQEQSPFGPDATEETLLSQVGHTGLSALGIVGNFLDLPGSMVRDALVFDNPLDQLLNPFSSEGRNSGRDVLTTWGITDQNMEGGMADWGDDYGEAAADIGGFAFEMAMDPLAWMTGGASKAGSVAGKGALAKTGKVLDTLDPGTHVGRIVNRDAWMNKNIAKAWGATTGKVGATKLGGKAGELIEKATLAGQEAFNYRKRGATTAQGQDLGEEYTKVFEGMQVEVNDYLVPALNSVWDEAKGADDIHDFTKKMGKQIRDALEGRIPAESLPGQVGVAVGRLKGYQKSLLKEAKGAGIRIDTLQDDVVDFAHRQMSESVKEYMNTHSLDQAAGSRGSGPSAVANREHQHIRQQLFKDGYTNAYDDVLSDDKIHDRLDEIWDMPRDTPEEMEAYNDAMAEVSGYIEKEYGHSINRDMKSVTKSGDFRMLDKDGREAVLSSKDLKVEGNNVDGYVVTSRVKKKLKGDKKLGPGEINDGDILTHQMDNRYDALATHMLGNPIYRKTGGLFGNVFGNITSGFRAAAHSIANAKSTTDMLADGLKNGILSAPVGRSKILDTDQSLISLEDFLGNQAMQALDPKHVYDKIKKANPHLNADDISKLRVDKTISDDILRAWDFQSAGSQKGVRAAIGNTFRSMTSMFKAGVLTHPARYMRDLTSGQIANMYNDMFSLGSAKSGWKAVFNQSDEKLLQIPEIQKYMESHGMRMDSAEDATRALREMYAARRSHIATIDRDLDTFSTDMDAGNDLEAMMGMFPGGTTGIKDLAKEMAMTTIGRRGKKGASKWGWLNPLNIAGVNKRKTTEFGAVEAGNILGKHTDDMNRMVGFIEGMKQGKSADEAMEAVNRVQLNYDPRTFTPLEQDLKKAFPFYSFASRELSYVANELMHNPAGKLGTIIRAGRHQEDEGEYLPGGVKGTMAVDIGEGDDWLTSALTYGRNKDIPEGTKNYFTGLGLMYEDTLDMLAPESLSEGLRTLGSQMNPLIKGGVELATGVSLFQGGAMGGRSLHDMDPVMGRILTQMGIQDPLPNKSAAPIGGSRLAEFVAANSPMSRILSSTKTALDDRKGYLERAMNLATGMRIQSVNPEQRRRGLRDLTDAIAREHGGRAFSNMTISKDLIESLEEGTEEHTTLTAIKELRKLWDRKRKAEQRAKDKEN